MQDRSILNILFQGFNHVNTQFSVFRPQGTTPLREEPADRRKAPKRFKWF